MDIVLLLILIVVIGWGGYWVSQRSTVTPQEQDAIVRGDGPLSETSRPPRVETTDRGT
jgi:hypothetical protein